MIRLSHLIYITHSYSYLIDNREHSIFKMTILKILSQSPQLTVVGYMNCDGEVNFFYFVYYKNTSETGMINHTIPKYLTNLSRTRVCMQNWEENIIKLENLTFYVMKRYRSEFCAKMTATEYVDFV